MFRNLAASPGTQYVLGALYAKVPTNAAGPAGAVSIGAQESEEPRRVRRDVSLMCASADM